MKIYRLRLRLRLRSKLPTPADSDSNSDSDSAALVQTILYLFCITKYYRQSCAIRYPRLFASHKFRLLGKHAPIFSVPKYSPLYAHCTNTHVALRHSQSRHNCHCIYVFTPTEAGRFKQPISLIAVTWPTVANCRHQSVSNHAPFRPVQF